MIALNADLIRSPRLMSAFIVNMLVIACLFVVLVGGIGFFNSRILSGQDLLTTQVLPGEKLSHELTTASAELQAQGSVLRTAQSSLQLQQMKAAIDLSIADTLELIARERGSELIDTSVFGQMLSNIQTAVDDLTVVRERQLSTQGELERLLDLLVTDLRDLEDELGTRIISLTDDIFAIEEPTLAGAREVNGASEPVGLGETAWERFKQSNLEVQDYLLLEQDIVSLYSLLEQLPLVTELADITRLEQRRDALIKSTVSKIIYITDKSMSDMLMPRLASIRAALNSDAGIFELKRSFIADGIEQESLGNALAARTRDIRHQTEQIQSRTENLFDSSFDANRRTMLDYRTFSIGILVLTSIVMFLVSYRLLYKQTAKPIADISRNLEKVGTDEFENTSYHYRLKEIQALALAVNALNDAHGSMNIKDRELRESNEELVSANEDLKQFAHVASHDLQEPLRKLSQFSQVITEDYSGKLDEDGQYCLDTIKQSADRMGEMIRDTLAYASSGRGDQSMEMVSLGTIVSELISEMDGLLAETQGEVLLHELPSVRANRTGVEQLFRNLMTNAFKYRRPGVTPQLQIRVLQEEPATRDFLIEVADNGIGIPESFLQRAFVPFERLKTNDTRGSGLGLAICTKVCHVHGWSLNLSSEVGVGSTFVIRIPGEAMLRQAA